MLDIDTINFMDFSFNGKYFSTFNAHVGGREAFKNFSALPSREITTEKLVGVDGEVVVSTRLNPRTFTIPIVVNDLSNGNLRDIAAWLDVSSPKTFFWKDDTIKINCMLDSGGVDFENIFSVYGLSELKFIAHDPYFYQITPSQITDTLTAPSDFTTIINLGNKPSLPKVKVNGTGTIVVKSYDASNTLLTTGTVTSVVSHVYIDSLEKRVYSMSGQTVTNLIANWSGQFPILDIGTVKITYDGTVTGSVIDPRFRWI